MITIDFGGDERRITPDISTAWVRHAYKENLKNSGNVCVQVTVEHENAKVSLSSGACGGSGGGKPFEAFSREAQHIITLWHKYNLNETEFPFGKLVRFLKELFKKFGMRLT